MPRIFIPSYPGYLYPRTPDIYTLIPLIFVPSYPGYAYPRTPDIYTLIPRIFVSSYPGYLYSRTPDICTLVPRIFKPSYLIYLYPRTPRNVLFIYSIRLPLPNRRLGNGVGSSHHGASRRISSLLLLPTMRSSSRNSVSDGIVAIATGVVTS